MTDAAIYTRVSTPDQVREGQSLADQRRRLEALALAKEWRIVCRFTDEGISGRKEARPGFQAILDGARAKKFSVVAVDSLSRFGRSAVDVLNALKVFDRKGVAFVSLAEGVDGSTSTGRLLITVLSAAAQWQAEVGGEQAKARAAYRRKHLLPYTGAAYGFRAEDGKLVPVPEQMAVVKRIRTMKSEGLTLRAVAERLNAEKIPAQRGGAWRTEQIRRVSTNPIYGEEAR